MSDSQTANVREIVRTNDVQETIEEFKQISGDFVGVVLLGISKNHAPVMLSSTMENYQMTYLGAFHQAKVADMFESIKKM